VHHVGILYDQFMMHGQRNIKFDVLVFVVPVDALLTSLTSFTKTPF